MNTCGRRDPAVEGFSMSSHPSTVSLFREAGQLRRELVDHSSFAAAVGS